MTFARGATLTTATTLGHADTSNLGPTAGNGFYQRWPDDLALLQETGITDLRLTFDWARLQSKPGEFDGAWADRYEQMLAACDAIDLQVWATLHDGAEPRWVTNEGGMGDDDVAEKWWPRFAEKVADRFGPSLAGWVPFAGIDEDLNAAAWRNTWAALGGGGIPVVASLAAERLDEIGEYRDIADMIGLVVTHEELAETGDDDERFANLRGHLVDTLGAAAEAADGRDIVITQFTPIHDDPDTAGQIVEAFVAATDTAIDDGAPVQLAFIDPAIAGPESPIGILNAERVAQPAAAAYVDD